MRTSIKEDTQRINQELQTMIIDQYCMAFSIMVFTSLLTKSEDVHNLDLAEYSGKDWRPENA